MTSFLTLFYKELLRFWKVFVQTVAAPVLTALLYLVVFAQALEGRVRVYESVPYTAFLVPGLVMMSILQNAFANSSSSLIQSKITGNIVFILLPPISHLQFFGAYVGAAIVRGLVVGAGVAVAALLFVPLSLKAPAWMLVKPSCVKLQNGWVSDRSLCYLASGKPVVTQDTGSSSYLPFGEGILRFSTPEEAAAALATVNANYHRHCQSARQIAETWFDARRIAERILNVALA